MRENYPVSIAQVFKFEGGYFNHPSDPGGPTNWGITIHDARKYWKKGATAADVKAMPKSVAEQIYKERYADAVHFDGIATGLDFSTLDAGVNSGVGRADDWLAVALQVPNTGYKSLADQSRTLDDAGRVAATKRYWDKRLSFLHGLKTWPVFGKGWNNRITAGRALALKMAGGVQVVKDEQKPVAKKIAKDVGKVAVPPATQVPVQPGLDAFDIGWGWKVAAVLVAVGATVYLVRRYWPRIKEQFTSFSIMQDVIDGKTPTLGSVSGKALPEGGRSSEEESRQAPGSGHLRGPVEGPEPDRGSPGGGEQKAEPTSVGQTEQGHLNEQGQGNLSEQVQELPGSQTNEEPILRDDTGGQVVSGVHPKE
jgi:lysozyme family protein